MPDKGPQHELEWFPIYPDRFFSSVPWKSMKDFQRGWYWQLLLQMTRSKPIGYLRFDDGQLWTLAGAHSRQYWDIHAALVLACFKVVKLDGHEWIYNQKLLDVLTEQQEKHEKAVQRGKREKNTSRASISSSTSYSEEFEKIWEECVWEKVSKKTAGAAFEKAVEVLMKQPPGVPVPQGPGQVALEEIVTKCGRNFAIHFLAKAIQQFKDSDAGKANGLFDGYQPPYPASWLNGQRYLDDRKKWYRTGAGTGTANVQQSDFATEGRNKIELTPGQIEEYRRSRAPLPDCPSCSGTGWKQVGGRSVTRCNCRLEKEKRDAANRGPE